MRGMVVAMALLGAPGMAKADFFDEVRTALACTPPAAPKAESPALGGMLDRADREAFAGLILALQDRSMPDAQLRRELHRYFERLDPDAAHARMEEIRRRGLLDTFLAVSLRDSSGRPVDRIVFETARELMRTGRLDVYAEVFTGTAIDVVSEDSGMHYFQPAKGSINLNRNLGKGPNVEEWKGVLAHEAFHAYSHAHGSRQSAMDEAFGIAAAKFALTDGTYDLAEMLYGTKNYYRDYMDREIAFGDMKGADRQLRRFLETLASRDRSGIRWNDPAQLQAEYAKYWEHLDRENEDTWPALAAKATEAMIRDHAADAAACPAAPRRFASGGTNVARAGATEPARVGGAAAAKTAIGAGMLRD